MILAIRSGTRIRDIRAFDTASFEPLSLAAEEGLVLEALLYEKPLDQLGLEAGPLTAGPATSRRRLPREDEVFAMVLNAEGAGSWQADDTPSQLLDAFRLVEDGTECPNVTVENHSLASLYSGALAKRLENGEVLLGDAAGELWLTDGANLRSVEARPRTYGFRGVAWSPDSDELFLGTFDGYLIRARLADDILEQELPMQSPSSGWLRWIDVVTSSVSLELYAMTHFGEVLHLRDDQWTVLHDFERPGDFAGLAGMIRVEGPGGDEIFAVAGEHDVVAHIVDGEVTLEPTESPSGLTEIAMTESFGLVVGNDRGQLFQRTESGRWRALPDSKISVWLLTVADVDSSSFLFAGAFGAVGLFRESGSCGGEQLLPADPFWLEPVGPIADRHFIAIGDAPANAELWYSEIWVE